MATELTQKHNYHAQTQLKATFSSFDGKKTKDFAFHSIKQMGEFLRSNQVPQGWLMSVEDQNLRGLDVRGAKLPTITFTNCCLDNASFDNASAGYMTIEGGTARGISLRGTKGEGITVSNVDMPGVHLEGAQWSNSMVENSNLARGRVDATTKFDSVGFSGSQVPNEIISMIPEGSVKTAPVSLARPQAGAGAPA